MFINRVCGSINKYKKGNRLSEFDLSPGSLVYYLCLLGNVTYLGRDSGALL